MALRIPNSRVFGTCGTTVAFLRPFPTSATRCFGWTTARLQSSANPAHSPPQETEAHISAFAKDRAHRVQKVNDAAPPLSLLPLSALVRSLAIHTISSNAFLLRPSLYLISQLANPSLPILNPDRNPVLRWILKRTIYAQFCAGENAIEVASTVNGVKRMGFEGVVLAYAKEIVMSHEEAVSLSSQSDPKQLEADLSDIEAWRRGTLETVRLATKGDFVALKFTGAGTQTMFHLTRGLPPPAPVEKALVDICDMARDRHVRLLFDAEQHAVQESIDTWTLNFMRRYNNQIPGEAIIYGTYQAYLKATPSVLSRHLLVASKEGFTLGVKLVRGAYLATDPRHIIHDTKAETDQAYDDMMEGLLQRDFTKVSPDLNDQRKTAYAAVNLVVASHNHKSTRRAQTIRRSQSPENRAKTQVVFAQLYGMADDLSCELLQEGKSQAAKERPHTYKYMVWGSTGECMKYLHRRATENRDAVLRTRTVRDSLAKEYWRRLKGASCWHHDVLNDRATVEGLSSGQGVGAKGERQVLAPSARPASRNRQPTRRTVEPAQPCNVQDVPTLSNRSSASAAADSTRFSRISLTLAERLWNLPKECECWAITSGDLKKRFGNRPLRSRGMTWQGK